ncbi:hypothetical protein ANN_23271 [Periplaneta americana]|uniref:Reverse transcriptase n=1 Tax=Periplaneta americana TaxID=6978 RepID=A0ABQ8SL31_PERAM|nr:hypothetical protein ANN_23271 [Periplaneta americana]
MTLRRSEEKRIEAFEMWIWRRMERVKLTDRIRDEAVLESYVMRSARMWKEASQCITMSSPTTAGRSHSRIFRYRPTLSSIVNLRAGAELRRGVIAGNCHAVCSRLSNELPRSASPCLHWTCDATVNTGTIQEWVAASGIQLYRMFKNTGHNFRSLPSKETLREHSDSSFRGEGYIQYLDRRFPDRWIESLRNRIAACSEDIRNTPGVWDRVRRSMRHRCEAHVGLAGNELADQLAKQAASNELPVSFDRIPVSDIMRELQEESVVKWESEWQNTINGSVTKSFFPSVKERLRVNIPLNGKVTTFLTGHGKTGAYLYRLKLRDNPSCACGAEEQAVDHLLFECPKLDKERLAFLREMLRKTGKWTFTKLKIMQEHAHTFTNYVNVINLDE